MSWSSFIVDAPGEPHQTVVEAVKLVGSNPDRRALDIGAGNGRDSRFLVESGFEVVAVDASNESAEFLSPLTGVSFIQADICLFPLGKYSLISASLILPFIERQRFSTLWPELISALDSGGVICGHFFGMQDWKVRSRVAWGAERAVILDLLRPLQVQVCDEFLGEGKNQNGEAVTKHNYSFVARVAT